MDLFDKLMNNVFSEYGAFVAFLLINNIAFGYTIRVLWRQNKELSQKLIELIEKSIGEKHRLLERMSHYENS